MRLSTIIFPVALLAMVGTSVAHNCRPGLKYCDGSLLKAGNYEKTVQNAVRAAGLTIDERSRILFQCLEYGAIELYVRCPYACQRLPEEAPGYEWADDYC
ncbi:hypothetical protein GX51_03690 [Blastomyces parvus]|uniref:Killer toxin Kp4 domain-containing protein n=1 Tax=Blastomyces parvus TaxID=2060905 RepID=A0A2B7X585_9EURO|nr:hypothetical protein GX51_03690 [Blastomyces parvus]